MTAPKPMTRKELIELAALDALGLLDDYEALLYTQSFHHAPSAVQDEIIELQAKIATDPALLPEGDEKPDPSLRERVLDFVNNEIENSAEELTPIATIGRSRAAAVAGMGATTVEDNPHVAGRINRSATFWRVATFAMCSAVVVMAYLLSDSAAQNSELARLALTNNTDARLEQMIRPTITEYLFNSSSQRIVLSSPDGDVAGRALLFFNEGEDQGLLVVDLPAASDAVYELTIRDSNGTSYHVAQFSSEERITGMHVAINRAAHTPGSTWVINGPEGFVLTSA